MHELKLHRAAKLGELLKSMRQAIDRMFPMKKKKLENKC